MHRSTKLMVALLVAVVSTAATLPRFLTGAVRNEPGAADSSPYRDREGAADAETDEKKPPTLDDLFNGRLKIVDLTYALNEKNPYWPGGNYRPFELKTIATLEQDGVLSKAFCMPEHLGTHIDAPNHFEDKQPALEQIPPDRLFGPGVMIDVAPQAEQDADYMLSVDDVKNWERAQGPIPEGAIVLLHTGWGRFWSNYDRYKNRDALGKLHFPGYSPEAARWLVERRKVRGIGIDTLSIDCGLSQDFQVHHVVNGAGKFGLENVANLDRLPPRGFNLVVAPIKIEAGSGGPTRIFAVLAD